jgi:ABC-type glycerol-3-phosphate transport system permease component
MQNKKISVADIVFKIITFTVLAVYALGVLALLAWGLLTSLKSRMDFSIMENVMGLPSWEHSKDQILLGNYALVLEKFEMSKSAIFYVGNTLIKHQTKSNILTMAYNTFIYAGVSTLLSTLCCYTVAYLCAKYRFRSSKLIYLYVLFIMTVPTVGTAPSMISVLRSLGVYDTLWTHIIQKFTFSGMYFFVFHAFFESMADAYTEAAEVDGASQLRIYLSIIIPLGAKIIGSVMLINFVTYWNDYNAPLMYTPTLPTLAYGVYHLCNEGGNAALKTTPGLVSSCMILAIPIIIAFVFLKDKLMGNVSMGGIKG